MLFGYSGTTRPLEQVEHGKLQDLDKTNQAK